MSSRNLTDAGSTDQFLIDPDWNQLRHSYSVQALAPPDVQEKLEALRQQVEALAPGCFHHAPRDRLHVSIQIIASPRHDYDKAAFWAKAEQPVRAVLSDFANTERAFRWHFDRLIAAPLGVIAAAPPDPRLHDLRLKLIKAAPQPSGDAAPYPLVHSTLLRYAAPGKLPADFAARVAALPCHVEWRAAMLELLRGQRYPSLVAATLARYPLEGA